MAKKMSDAQKYVQLAKKRLVNNDYGEFDRKGEVVFFINNHRLSDRQIDSMNEAIDQIAASDVLVYDALSRLIVDKEEFSSLNDGQREKYVLELSKIYAYLRNKKK